MSDETGPLLSDLLPTPRDPRIALAMPERARAKIDALWQLAERLSKLLSEVREPMIGQLKLAWWRDMTRLLAEATQDIPKGEPLLATLQDHWAGEDGLTAIVDAAEALLLAEDEAQLTSGATEFGGALFAAMAKTLGRADAPMVLGARWGLLWGAYYCSNSEEAEALAGRAQQMGAPAASRFGKGLKSLLMLDRLAGEIATKQGLRDPRAEGLILLRIGILGR